MLDLRFLEVYPYDQWVESWTVFQTESILIDISEPNLGGETFFPLFILYPGFIFLMSRKFDWSGWKIKLISKL